MKSIYKNLFLFSASLLLSLFVVEIALRYISPEERSSDSILGVVGTPGGEIDENGFRNEKVVEKVDIVAIGDSQTYGNNAKTSSEAWPQRLGQLSGKSVYQMAFGGYGPVQYRYLTDKALELDPELIVVGLYTGNDFYDAYNLACKNENWKKYCTPGFIEEEKTDTAGKDIRLTLGYGYDADDWRLKIIKVRIWIRNNSRLYALLGNASRGFREKIGLAEKKDEITQRVNEWAEKSDDAIFYEYNDTNTIMSPSYRFGAVDLEKDVTAEGYKVFERVFGEMREMVNKQGIAFRVAIVPTKEMVFYRYSEITELNNLDRLKDYIKKEAGLIKKVEGFLNDNGIDYYLLTEDLAGAIRDGIQIYTKSMDGHPNSEGDRIIAESLNKCLFLKEATASTSSEELIIEELE